MKTQDINYYKYATAIIRIAVEEGFEPDENDSFDTIASDAANYLLKEEPCGHEFVHCPFSWHGYMQGYGFVDESGYEIEASGEIFDFSHHWRKEDETLYLKEGDNYTPVNWYDIPDPDDESRENYIYVYDYQPMSNGKVAWLYDHFSTK